MLTLNATDQARLDAYCHEVRTRRPGVGIHLAIYGSKAYWDARNDIDLDVLVVARNDTAGLKRPLRHIGYNLAVDSCAAPSVAACARAEWDQLNESRSPSRELADRDGVAVL